MGPLCGSMHMDGAELRYNLSSSSDYKGGSILSPISRYKNDNEWRSWIGIMKDLNIFWVKNSLKPFLGDGTSAACALHLCLVDFYVKYDFIPTSTFLIIHSQPIATDTKGLLPSCNETAEAETHLSRSNSTSSTRKSLVSTSLWICWRSSSSFCRSSLDLSLSAAQNVSVSAACLGNVRISFL